MKIKSNTSSKYIVAGIAAAILVVGGLSYLALDGQFDELFGSKERQTGSKQNEPAVAADNIANSAKDKIAAQSGDTPKEKSQLIQTTDYSSSLGVSITQATQRDAQVVIRALIEGSNSGTCTVTFTKDGETVTKTAPYAAQASYVICQGFNIPVSEFPSAGEWQMTVSAVSKENIKGTASSKVKISL